MHESGDDGTAALTHISLGTTVLLLQGDKEGARRRFEEGLALSRSLGDRMSVCSALFNLAQLALAGGDYEAAYSRFAEGIAPSEELGDRGNIAYILEGLGIVAGARGESLKAARLLGASEALISAIGLRGHTYYRSDPHLYEHIKRSLYERIEAKVRAALGEAAFGAAWAEGRGMYFEQAIEYALEEPTTSGEEEGTRSPAPLSGSRPAQPFFSFPEFLKAGFPGCPPAFPVARHFTSGRSGLRNSAHVSFGAFAVALAGGVIEDASVPKHPVDGAPLSRLGDRGWRPGSTIAQLLKFGHMSHSVTSRERRPRRSAKEWYPTFDLQNWVYSCSQ